MDRALNVLIVEDSEDDALLLLRELHKQGCQTNHKLIDTPEAMQEALAVCEWYVVISDYSMPRFSGVEALQMLKENGLDIPLIIVSGKTGEETAVQIMKAGAHDYLVKGRLARLAPAIEREMQEAEERRKLREAEAALRESEARYRYFLESVTDYIYTVEIENGQPRGLLERYGFTVVEAADGEEALSRFNAQRDEIGLVIADVIMPKKNGREMYAEISRQSPGTKVIFVSGYTADVFPDSGLAGDDVHFLAKPIIPGELLRYVRHVLDGKG